MHRRRGPLAEEVHLSPTAVLERVKRLTRENYILGYEARLNPNKLGASMMVFIEVLLDRTAPDIMDTFKAAVQTRPEILECHLLAGAHDYLMRVIYRDSADFERIHTDIITQLPGVTRVQSTLTLRTIKKTSALPV